MCEKIDIKETVKAIIAWANRNPLSSISVSKFNEKLEQPDVENFLKEACSFCGIKPVFIQD